MASASPKQSRRPAPDEWQDVPLGFPGVSLRVARHHLLLRSATTLAVLSSAPYGGGVLRTRRVLSSHVPEDSDCSDPAAFLERRAIELGVQKPFVGMLTAADLRRAAIVERRDRGVPTLVIVTAGTGNAWRVGDPPFAGQSSYGTINTIVLVDAQPMPAAFTNAIITATEAKTLALVEADVRTTFGKQATGTSTDAVIVAATMRGPELPYAGPATELGASIGAAVLDATTLALRQPGDIGLRPPRAIAPRAQQ